MSAAPPSLITGRRVLRVAVGAAMIISLAAFLSPGHDFVLSLDDGVSSVLAAPADSDTEPDKTRNREKTSSSGKQQYEVQGTVLKTLCSCDQKELVVGTLDGPAILNLFPRYKNRGLKCTDVTRGDYVFATQAERQNANLFDVYELHWNKDVESEDTTKDENNEKDGEPRLRHKQKQDPAQVAAFHQANPDSDDEEHRIAQKREEDNINDNDNDNVNADEQGSPIDPYLMAFAEVHSSLNPGQASTINAWGNRVSLDLGSDAVKKTTKLAIAGIDPGSVPGPPGPKLGDYLFEIAIEICGDSSPNGTLPASAKLTARYTGPDLQTNDGTKLDESRLALAFLDESGKDASWKTIPSTVSNGTLTASINQEGVYVIYQR